MLLFNFELIFPLLKNAGMKGVVFFDTGNAWNNTYDLGDMRKTAGAGIRWYSPVGPLRLEWGYVLDPKPRGAGLPLGLHDGVDDVRDRYGDRGSRHEERHEATCSLLPSDLTNCMNFENKV